jgi:hypothetical protein
MLLSYSQGSDIWCSQNVPYVTLGKPNTRIVDACFAAFVVDHSIVAIHTCTYGRARHVEVLFPSTVIYMSLRKQNNNTQIGPCNEYIMLVIEYVGTQQR